MARPKAFDTNAALLQATHVFWERGYDGTSLDDLVGSLRVHRASLYGTFGAKRDLFLAALDLYARNMSAQLAMLFSIGGSARDTLAVALRFIAACESGLGPSRGCLMTNTSLELGGRGDVEIDRRLDQYARSTLAAFTVLIARGQAEGEIISKIEARALALTVLSTIQGMRVAGRGGATRAELDTVVETTLSLLST